MSHLVRGFVLILGLTLGLAGQSSQNLGLGELFGDHHPPSPETPATPTWAFGQPGAKVESIGLLAHADQTNISLELPDQRVFRFRWDAKTRFSLQSAPAKSSVPAKIGSFHVADVVRIASVVDGHGYLNARSVSFLRSPTPSEEAEIFQSPELFQRWQANLLSPAESAETLADRNLAAVNKPDALAETSLEPVRSSSDDTLLRQVRQSVNEAFGKLPNFRARLVTSMFGSTSRPVKWIPEGLVSADIAYEDDRESYSQIRVDGKEPRDAPEIAGPDYMRSLDLAWSTGDFETIAHCVLSELADTDLRRAEKDRKQPDIVTYEFQGKRSSACIGVSFTSQVAYPSYKGSMKIDAQTGKLIGVEFAATGIPNGFPLDRAERSVTYGTVKIGSFEYTLPVTAYWFGCFRNSYSCFLNRIDFRDYRRFETETNLSFER